MAASTKRDVLALPKAHLHLHVTGSIRPATLVELADRAGRPVPRFASRYTTWEEFLAAYRSVKPLLRRAEDLHRVVVELLENDAAAGAVWTEISISPTGAHRALTGSDQATLEVVTDAIAATRPDAAGVVVAADRGRDADDPDPVARLAGDETRSCRSFARAAAIARDAGLVVAPHAGETVGPTSIREALAVLRPDRIMHGVRAAEDPDLLGELADRGIALDVCPTSNVALGVMPSVADHPLAALRRAGIRCSLNADDTLVFDTDLAADYRLAREVRGIDAWLTPPGDGAAAVLMH